ncbi:DUF4244 domain-containing protein [Frigoribacterium sp. CFBP 8766]|uniref:DUF4244 domain-containing protein n=1 Tax=Frigoribacterium sp. CFBP 8766 TaxID=2775273 RepID=UPI0017874836|nr:DUF4244 domain-containing protein [Frigoribacterium sp. CFBP 8766]MBD8585012.1 DUF4244 domain-containing protein [Frigoribacterium sp. CFBP 8766]
MSTSPTTTTAAADRTFPPVPVPVTAAGRADRASRTRRRWLSEDGAATAEYAIVIMAAVGFAGLLVVIMRSDEVRGVLSDLVRSALSVG